MVFLSDGDFLDFKLMFLKVIVFYKDFFSDFDLLKVLDLFKCFSVFLKREFKVFLKGMREKL